MLKLRDILGVLRDSYCRTVGIEYMHIQDPEQRAWIQDKRRGAATPSRHRDEQLRILRRLNAAEAFETFLQTKYVGQKRFSLEGGESVIALLDAILCRGRRATASTRSASACRTAAASTCWPTSPASPTARSSASSRAPQDPKSRPGLRRREVPPRHRGHVRRRGRRQTKVYLAANPSHLEAVDPVLEGIVRAKQDRLDLAGEAFTVLPILMHGDAAFAGQGVVVETLNLSQLRGYRTGGTIHVVINNQVGFTTSPSSSRSSIYSTDVARMIQAPIFHVNGDDPEACVRVAELAFEFRQEFNKDVVIDLVCYRRRGHNEGDDPSMTQPLMYNLIEAKRSVRKLYTEALIGRGDITVEEAEEALRDYQAAARARLRRDPRPQARRRHDADRSARRRRPRRPRAAGRAGCRRRRRRRADATTADHRRGRAAHRRRVREPARGLHGAPASSQQLLAAASAMTREGGIDWALGELLAFGSLLLEGAPVRLAGQDSPPRHVRPAARRPASTGRPAEEWTPLLYLCDGPGPVLGLRLAAVSEYAAMGFEYGYSVERPDALVLWEAQFGDFVNGAQTIIDEFISSRRAEVGPALLRRAAAAARLRGPGPGPLLGAHRALPAAVRRGQHDGRHARRRPASYFHLLRRQAYARPRRPLDRLHPEVDAAAQGAASRRRGLHLTAPSEPVLADPAPLDAGRGRPGSCSARGKIYYDLRGRAREDRRRPTPRSSGSSSSPAAGQGDRRRARRRTRTPSWSGCRTSRPTRARGRSWPSTCRRPGRARREPQPAGRRAPGVGLAGDRVEQEARGPAGGPDRPGVRPLRRPTLRRGGHRETGARPVVRHGPYRRAHDPRRRGSR